MGYTHDHGHRASGSLQVDSDIFAHLRLAHDTPDPESMTKASAYAYHDLLDTHVPWDEQEEIIKREAIHMGTGRKKGKKKGKSWTSGWSTPKRTYVRKSVAEALEDIVPFTRRKTWQEVRKEKGTYLIEVTHTMLVEVTDDFDVACFAADNKGAMPTDKDEIDTPETQLELFYIGGYDFDHLMREDRPRIVDETFVYRDVEAPLSPVN